MGIFYAILSAIFAALVIILTKAGLKDMDPTLAFAMQGVLILIITWSIVLWQGAGGQLGGLSKRTWLFMLAAGVCTTLSTVFSYRSLKLSDATLVTPIERMSLVLSVILAVVFLKEKMTWQAVVGIVLMTGGVILVGFSKK